MRYISLQFLVLISLAVLFAGVSATAQALPDQTKINTYGTSFNRNLLGQKDLLELFVKQPDGSIDLDVFVPVWGRGVTLGVWEGFGAPKHTLFPQYLDAAGPRSVAFYTDDGSHLPSLPQSDPAYVPYQPTVLVDFDTSPNDSVWQNNPSAHANATFARLCPRALGARGATDIQCWWGHQVPFSFLPWMCGTPTETEFEPADVMVATYMVSANNDHMIHALEKASDDFDISFVYSAGNGPGTLNANQTTVFGTGQSMYNAIAVGAAPSTFDEYPTSYSTAHYTTDGGTEWGYGTEGRMKPDICSVGHKQTSFLAPIVGAMSARLREAGIFHFGENTDANKAEVNKAILLSGATKAIDYDTPHPVHGNRWEAWTRTPERPLDFRFGAGIANIKHSYDILAAGPGQVEDFGAVGDSLNVGPGPYAVSDRNGWAADTVGAGERKIVHFPVGGLRDFHFTLTWNLEVTQLEGGTDYAPNSNFLHYESDTRLADLNLKLVGLGTTGQAWLIDESRSAIDNVEHLYVDDLPRMNSLESYAVIIENTSDFPTPFALAWRGEEAVRPVINIFAPSGRKALQPTFQLNGWIEDESDITTVETGFGRIINGQWLCYQADGSLAPDFHFEPLATTPWVNDVPLFDTIRTLPPANAGEGIAIWLIRVIDEHGNTTFTGGPVFE